MKKNLHKLDSLVQEIAKSPESKDRLKQLEEAVAMYARNRSKERLVIEQYNEDNTIKFLAMGDTHFGSMYERLDIFKAALKFAEVEKITDILHAGDVLDGHKIYKGQEFELHKHGWDRQSKWFAQQVPVNSKVKVHFITGNHDASFKREAGIEPGEGLIALRPDWHYLGSEIADITFKTPKGSKYKVALIHPGGGSSYALSYRSQKIVDQWSGGTKPNMLLIGHYHKAEFIPSYRNVAILQVGCGQAQTPFMARQALAAHVGFWSISIAPGDKYNRIKAEFIAVYK